MTELTRSQVTCMLPVKDLARARRFYEQQLGLEPQGAKPDGKFIYRCGGTEVARFPSPRARRRSTRR
ncbi:MAG TPA: VOC family protein [Burkholderiaceae bacterium]